MHGITAVGASLDEVFGLIETVEKAAEIYIKISDKPNRQGIDKAMLRDVADAFNLEIKKRMAWLKKNISFRKGNYITSYEDEKDTIPMIYNWQWEKILQLILQ